MASKWEFNLQLAKSFRILSRYIVWPMLSFQQWQKYKDMLIRPGFDDGVWINFYNHIEKPKTIYYRGYYISSGSYYYFNVRWIYDQKSESHLIMTTLKMCLNQAFTIKQ